MDPRLKALNGLRKMKMEAAQRDFSRAFQEFAVAYRRVETMTQRRDGYASQAAETTRNEMSNVMVGAATATEIQAIHGATERRNNTLALMARQIDQAIQERERLREIAIGKQRIFAAARKAVEKLGILTEKLRLEEISLHNRMAESYADSASRDAVTGQWKLRLMD